MLRRILLVVALVVASSFGCLQPVTELERTHDFVVGPEGGRFDVEGGASLFFPVNSVPEPRSIKVTKISPSVYAPGLVLGDAWLLEPEGAEFLQFVHVTVPITKSIPANARLRVARAKNHSRFYELLFPTRTLDGLRVNSSHFSVFVPVALVPDGGVDEPLDGGHAPDAG